MEPVRFNTKKQAEAQQAEGIRQIREHSAMLDRCTEGQCETCKADCSFAGDEVGECTTALCQGYDPRKVPA